MRSIHILVSRSFRRRSHSAAFVIAATATTARSHGVDTASESRQPWLRQRFLRSLDSAATAAPEARQRVVFVVTAPPFWNCSTITTNLTTIIVKIGFVHTSTRVGWSVQTTNSEVFQVECRLWPEGAGRETPTAISMLIIWTSFQASFFFSTASPILWDFKPIGVSNSWPLLENIISSLGVSCRVSLENLIIRHPMLPADTRASLHDNIKSCVLHALMS